MNNSSVQKEKRPIDLPTMESISFVETYVSLKDATVLEVGAGKGDLAVALMERGAKVRALDLFQDAVAAARAKGVDARLVDFLEYSNQPFDVVVFTRSLHHIHPLEKAVKNAASLLKPSGVLLVEEFGAELADAMTVQWLHEKLSQLEKDGEEQEKIGTNDSSHACVESQNKRSTHEGEIGCSKHSSKTESLQKWREHHFGRRWISDSAAVREALAKEFTLKPPIMVPYLYRYAIDKLKENQEGYAELVRIFQEEKEMIAKGALRPIGLNIVGKKR